MARRLGSASIVAAAALLLAGCSPVTPDQVGVTLSDDGEPLVLFAPCSDEQMTEIRLFDISGNADPEELSRPVPEVWSAQVTDGQTLTQVTLGEEQEGLEVTVELASPLSTGRPYAVEVEFADPSGERGADDVTDFRIDDLTSGQVLIGNPPDPTVVPTARFEDGVADECADATQQPWPIYAAAGVAAAVVLAAAVAVALVITRSRRSKPGAL